MGFNTYPVNPFPQSSEQMGSGGGGGGLTPEQKALIESVPTKADKANIAPEFSDMTNYNAGDLVYYDDKLYQFSVEHTAGPWNNYEAIEKDLSDIINSGSGSGGVTYSTAEREIGTWIDGNKLYERTFNIFSNGVAQYPVSNSEYDIGLTEVDTAFVYGIVGVRLAGTPQYVDWGNTPTELIVVLNKTAGKIYINPKTHTYDNFYVTIRYTKA